MKGKASGYLMPPFVQPCAHSLELPGQSGAHEEEEGDGLRGKQTHGRMDLDLGWTEEFGHL